MTTFQTPAPIAVTIEVLAGNVTVIATDRTDTVVEVRPADASKKADVRVPNRPESTSPQALDRAHAQELAHQHTVRR